VEDAITTCRRGVAQQQLPLFRTLSSTSVPYPALGLDSDSDWQQQQDRASPERPMKQISFFARHRGSFTGCLLSTLLSIPAIIIIAREQSIVGTGDAVHGRCFGSDPPAICNAKPTPFSEYALDTVFSTSLLRYARPRGEKSREMRLPRLCPRYCVRDVLLAGALGVGGGRRQRLHIAPPQRTQ
jgi:hypothetical protein